MGHKASMGDKGQFHSEWLMKSVTGLSDGGFHRRSNWVSVPLVRGLLFERSVWASCRFTKPRHRELLALR